MGTANPRNNDVDLNSFEGRRKSGYKPKKGFNTFVHSEKERLEYYGYVDSLMARHIIGGGRWDDNRDIYDSGTEFLITNKSKKAKAK